MRKTLKTKNREINFKDLAVEILLHWRGIFIAMVLGGILGVSPQSRVP